MAAIPLESTALPSYISRHPSSPRDSVLVRRPNSSVLKVVRNARRPPSRLRAKCVSVELPESSSVVLLQEPWTKIGIDAPPEAEPEAHLQSTCADDVLEDDGKKMRTRGGSNGRGDLVAESETRSGVVIFPERAKVVALVSFVMMLCNANRVVMSVAVVPLSLRYGWTTAFLGIVQSSFLWGYLVSSIAGGAMADRYGGKRVMAWGAALWSMASFLTPWASQHSTAMLLVVRAIFGLAEGVAMPCMNTLLSGWFPSSERASAVGISMAGFHLGNVIGLLVAPPLMAALGITGPFALLASFGFLWLSFWVPGVTNDPRDSDSIGSSELRLILEGKRPGAGATKNRELPDIRHLFSKLPTWAIVFANVTNNWGYFVLLSWMPVYFKTVFNINLKQAAWFSAIPWGMMAVSGYVAGSISDLLIRSRYSVTSVRKIMQSVGFLGPGLSLLCLKYANTPTAAAVLLTVALSLSSFSQAGFLLNMQDIAPQYAGFLHGITNSLGTLSAIVSTIGTGYFVEWLGSFQAFLTVTAALYFAATVFWNLFATGERVF